MSTAPGGTSLLAGEKQRNAATGSSCIDRRSPRTAARERARSCRGGPPLPALDAAALFDRMGRFGDLAARDELVRRFLPLAHKLARRYSRSSEPYEDLVQVASLGLLKAVERYDPRREASFTSYAIPTITGELKRYFRDAGWSVHVPRGAQER
ncbi:MAG: sigma-70 family RNA polymerase sigma factor, partial [Solirubrobacteraceae bacterium]